MLRINDKQNEIAAQIAAQNGCTANGSAVQLQEFYWSEDNIMSIDDFTKSFHIKYIKMKSSRNNRHFRMFKCGNFDSRRILFK